MILFFLDFHDKLAIFNVDILWDVFGVHKLYITLSPPWIQCVEIIAEVKVKAARLPVVVIYLNVIQFNLSSLFFVVLIESWFTIP